MIELHPRTQRQRPTTDQAQYSSSTLYYLFPLILYPMASPGNSTVHAFSNDPNLRDVYLHATLQQINHLANEDVEMRVRRMHSRERTVRLIDLHMRI